MSELNNVSLTLSGDADYILHTMRTFVGSVVPISQTAPAPVAQPAPEPQLDTANKTGKRGKARAIDAQPVTTAAPAPMVATVDGTATVTSATVAEGTAEPEKKLLTLDDVRAAAAPYIKKFTIAAAQEDLQYALDAAVGKRTMSALDDKNQDELAKAVAAFDAAAAAEARFPKPADWK